MDTGPSSRETSQDCNWSRKWSWHIIGYDNRGSLLCPSAEIEGPAWGTSCFCGEAETMLHGWINAPVVYFECTSGGAFKHFLRAVSCLRYEVCDLGSCRSFWKLFSHCKFGGFWISKPWLLDWAWAFVLSRNFLTLELVKRKLLYKSREQGHCCRYIRWWH